MASVRTNARKIVCIGRNYADHISELKNARPRQPFFFLKPSSSILPPNTGPLLIPKGVQAHYEVELGCIVGCTVQDLPDDEAAAISAIESYCLAIDMTARNVQEEAKKKGLPWSIAKGFDTFLPLSEPIDKDKITDPHNVDLQLSINGEARQQDSTALMLFRIPTILSAISRCMTLEKGDLILTGTPKGVGEIKVGDQLSATLSVRGDELARIDIRAAEKGGLYVFSET